MVSIRHPKPDLPPRPHSPAAEPPPADFPVHLLPPSMAAAITAVAARTQAPVALVAHHALTLAAMAAQRMVNVRLPTGQQRPVSCFFVTAASAAERRDAAAALTIGPARAWRQSFYAPEGGSVHQKAHIGANGLVLFVDSTTSGAPDRYRNSVDRAGLFARHPDDVLRQGPHRHREAASLSRLWDGAVTEYSAGALAHPRLSLHLVGTPRELRAFLGDAGLVDTGFSARLLLSRPASNIGARTWIAADEEAPPPEFTQFLASLATLYTAPAAPESRLLALPPPAAAAWFAFAREVEDAMGADGAFASIAAFAGLLPEHAARLAAVCALIDDNGASEIGAAALERGIGLARFYAAEAVRMFDFAPPRISAAEKAETLKEWVARRPGKKLRLRDICTFGPATVRNAAAAYTIMRGLERAGVVEPANDVTKGDEKERRPRAPYQWRVVPAGEAGMQQMQQDAAK